MTRVAWITCRVLPEADQDEAPALAALRAAGVDVERVAWDDPGAPDPARFSTCVLRSCWNYYRDVDAFRAWIERTSARSRLHNPAAAVRWNLHKRYLEALQERGVPIVPTLCFERGARVDVRAQVPDGWRAIVIKPAVSAASFETQRFAAGDTAAQAFLDRTLADRDMMIQEFVPAVHTTGERACVWIAGAFTHAVIKRPRFADDAESVSAPVPLRDPDARLGEQALRSACADGGFALADLLYARADIVDHRGRPALAELELIEPSLFVAQAPAALARFVRAVAALV